MIGIVNQLGNAGSVGQKVDEQALNFLLSVVKGIQPKDQLETMLAAQMAAVHSLTMTYARRLANAEALAQQESAERTLNKLARTFAAQVEALKRYRTGGEQKVTVEHVTVNEGGQAIVGNVSSSRARGRVVQKIADYPMPRVHCGARTRLADHAGNRQCATVDADSTAERANRAKRHGRYKTRVFYPRGHEPTGANARHC